MTKTTLLGITDLTDAQALQTLPDLTATLIDIAMQVCDLWDDSEPMRMEMRGDCLSLAPDQQRALLQHFRGVYPGVRLDFRQCSTGNPPLPFASLQTHKTPLCARAREGGAAMDLP